MPCLEFDKNIVVACCGEPRGIELIDLIDDGNISDIFFTRDLGGIIPNMAKDAFLAPLLLPEKQQFETANLITVNPINYDCKSEPEKPRKPNKTKTKKAKKRRIAKNTKQKNRRK